MVSGAESFRTLCFHLTNSTRQKAQDKRLHADPRSNSALLSSGDIRRLDTEAQGPSVVSVARWTREMSAVKGREPLDLPLAPSILEN